MSSPASASRRRARLRARRRRRALVLLTLAVLAVWGAWSLVSALLPTPDDAVAGAAEAPAVAAPTTLESVTPTPTPTPVPEPALCDRADVVAALADGTDADVLAAFGGAAAFRAAVAGGAAPCVDLHEAGRTWAVVNKRHPLDPIDHWPTPQARPQSTRIIAGGYLRADAAAALDELSAAAREAGAGVIAVDSGFRPYSFQVDTYRRHVANRGQAGADLRSARPGHSEHQTGLAVDVVACGTSGCGDHDGFGRSAQGLWVAENAWRFGFVVRYEEGRTPITGYSAEPWHLRYLGRDLAAGYRDGGFTTLEEFFGLEPAPDYD